MPTEAPLLTIAIPTYNRSRYLRRLLDSLRPQLEEEENRKFCIELLISDNASPDGTPALLEGYRHSGLVFRSLRNASNIGADGNFVQCFTEASGRYVWIVGDDDIILAGGLAVVLGLLVQDEYDILHLNARTIDSNEETRKNPRHRRVEIIEDARKFALRTHVYLTFITGNIINKERVMSLRPQPFSELIGTNLVQLGWTFTALRYFRKGAYVRDPIIAGGDEDRGGYELFKVFGTNLKRITETWLVEPAMVRIVLNGTIQKFFPHFVLRARLGEETFHEENRYEDLPHTLFRSIPLLFFSVPYIEIANRASSSVAPFVSHH